MSDGRKANETPQLSIDECDEDSMHSSISLHKGSVAAISAPLSGNDVFSDIVNEKKDFDLSNRFNKRKSFDSFSSFHFDCQFNTYVLLQICILVFF